MKSAIESLSDASGARADYIELRHTLDALNTALDAASNFNTAAHKAAAENVLQGCKKCVTDFLADIAGFEQSKNPLLTQRKLKLGLKKVQWAVCKQKDVLQFKGHPETHVNALQVLLLTFQMYRNHISHFMGS